jgi:hypothetical protein
MAFWPVIPRHQVRPGLETEDAVAVDASLSSASQLFARQATVGAVGGGKAMEVYIVYR